MLAFGAGDGGSNPPGAIGYHMLSGIHLYRYACGPKAASWCHVAKGFESPGVLLMPPKRSYERGPKVEIYLKDADFRRWWEQLGNGSPSTADAWSRRLRGFCQETRTTPKGLLAKDGKQLRDLFIDHISREQRRGSVGSYIAYSLKVARSWLRINDREVPFRLKIRDAGRVREETALSQEQIAAVLDHASAREKVAVSLMAMSGVCPERSWATSSAMTG